MSAAADVLGLGLHVVALRAGALVVVQTVLVSGVVFALAFERLLTRRPPRAEQLAWATVLVAGLGAFLFAAGLP